MQSVVQTAYTSHAYFEVKPGSVQAPDVEVALTVLAGQCPGIVNSMVRQVSSRAYTVRLFLTGGASAPTWVRVMDIPYEVQGSHYGQCLGNPPVVWATLVERALQQCSVALDVRSVMQALTGQAGCDVLSSRASMERTWTALCRANTHALVVTRLLEAEQPTWFAVLGAYSDRDGTRRVIVQHAREPVDMSLAHFMVAAQNTYVFGA